MQHDRPKLYLVPDSGLLLEPEQQTTLDAIKARNQDDDDVRWQFCNTNVLVHTSTGHYLVAEDGSYQYISSDGAIRLSMPGPTEISTPPPGGFSI